MTYKIISMDFDGTLLTSDKKITERTKKALEECRNNGYYIIGVTARNIKSTKGVLDISLFDYIILNNGAFVLNCKTNEILPFGVLATKDIEKIESIFEGTNAKCEYVSLTTYYLKDTYDPTGYRTCITSRDEINEEIARMNIYVDTEEQLDYYKKVVLENMDTVNVVSMRDTDNKNTRLWLTINDKGTNKLIALTKIADQLSINLDEVIFFGDGENDLLLLENVGMGVAMGNAIDIVKERSKAVTLSNDEEGICDYLTRIRVIK